MVTVLDLMLMQVERFHREVSGQPMPEKPTLLTPLRKKDREGFLAEELLEYQRADTIADQVDALIDLTYVALGGLLEMGVLPGPAFEQVHAANMTKRRGVTKRGMAFDTVKPEDWAAPDYTKYIDITLSDLDRLLEMRSQPEMYFPDHAVRPTKAAVFDDSSLASAQAHNPFDNSCGWRPKILILGYARHGKDTVAEYLRDAYGLNFTSSSMFCAERVMLPYFKANQTPTSPSYESAGECFDDRHNHRATWFQQIEAFNTPDKASLGRAIFAEHDIYCGLRSAREFHAVKNSGLYDVCLWVDALQRHDPEPRTSCTVEPWMADHIIDNNGSIDELKYNVDTLMTMLGISKLPIEKLGGDK